MCVLLLALSGNCCVSRSLGRSNYMRMYNLYMYMYTACTCSNVPLLVQSNRLVFFYITSDMVSLAGKSTCIVYIYLHWANTYWHPHAQCVPIETASAHVLLQRTVAPGLLHTKKLYDRLQERANNTHSEWKRAEDFVRTLRSTHAREVLYQTLRTLLSGP